jgi:hypothetical protein
MPRSFVTRTPEFPIPDFPKWEISRHMASFNQTVQIYFGAFAPIHWGFNPRVSPNRSNGSRVFHPRSDGSDRFLTCAFSHDFLDVEKSMVQMFSWTLGIYNPDLFATHEDTERQGGKAFNPLLSPTNIMVMGDHRFSDGISSVDQHLFRVKALNTPVTSSDLTAMSDHRSPDGISSIGSILIKDFLRPYAFTSFFQVLDEIFEKGISMGSFTQGTIWGR